MAINTDHQLREQMSHDTAVFPITYFHDELALLPNYEGPLHWHLWATAVSEYVKTSALRKLL